MKYIGLILMILSLMKGPVFGAELTAPEVPQVGAEFMPEIQSSFATDLWYLIKTALGKVDPYLKEAGSICLCLIAIALLLSLLQNITNSSVSLCSLIGAISVGIVLLNATNSMIRLATDTIHTLSDYGKLLLPVMTTALAAQGGIQTSTGLFTATALFDTVLCTLIRQILVPMIYVYLALGITACVTDQLVIKHLKGFMKWTASWCLKLLMYIFTGYISITGVVAGTTDAAALKATKITISGMIPVVGGILSDASESVIIGAAALKNGIGVYGLLAIIAVTVGPFLQIGSHYLLLKLTTAFSGIFGSGKIMDILQDFTTAMGLLLAMTGAVCLMLLISVVCFMKGLD